MCVLFQWAKLGVLLGSLRFVMESLNHDQKAGNLQPYSLILGGSKARSEFISDHTYQTKMMDCCPPVTPALTILLQHPDRPNPQWDSTKKWCLRRKLCQKSRTLIDEILAWYHLARTVPAGFMFEVLSLMGGTGLWGCETLGKRATGICLEICNLPCFLSTFCFFFHWDLAIDSSHQEATCLNAFPEWQTGSQANTFTLVKLLGVLAGDHSLDVKKSSPLSRRPSYSAEHNASRGTKYEGGHCPGWFCVQLNTS
jgi:hypothetical protein